MSPSRHRRGPLRDAVASIWVLVPLVTFGWLSGAAFLYAGIRARSRRWIGWAAAYGVLGIAAMVVAFVDASAGDIDTVAGSVAVATSLGLMVGATCHAAAIRGEYLERISGSGTRRGSLERAERKLEEREQALELARKDPLRARELGIGRPDLRGGHHGHLVDLNHASAEAVAKLPRMDAASAERLVTLRDEVGGFASLEDAGHVLDLPAATVERLRGEAVCLPY